MDDLGISDGSLVDYRPLLPLTISGPAEASYNATEVFGEEIATFVTSDSLYRETLYNIVIPYSESLRARVASHMTEIGNCTTDPWVYFRERLIVSI